MVAGGRGFLECGGTIGEESRQQQAALHLGESHRQPVVQRAKAAATGWPGAEDSRALPASTVAPMRRKGYVMRAMGRRCRGSHAPATMEQKGCPASMPERRRMVVPELPQSSTREGSASPHAHAVDDDAGLGGTLHSHAQLREAGEGVRQSAGAGSPVAWGDAEPGAPSSNPGGRWTCRPAR